jgi:hypothetical protein
MLFISLKDLWRRNPDIIPATLLQLLKNLSTFAHSIVMLTNHKIWNTGYKLLRACSVLAFLFLYILGSVEIESLHGLSHEQELSQLHSAESETDPCHINLYHEQRSQGCEHPTHVTKADKCSLCDSHLHNAHILTSVGINIDSFSTIDPSIKEEPRSVEGFFSYLPGRAPPVL